MEEKQQSTGIRALWQNLSRPGRISVVVLSASFLLALVLFIRHYSTPKMGLLFRGLSAENASAVIERLNEMGVPYRLGAGGHEILVDESRIDELRITLNSDGTLYGGGVGFELFDQAKLGVSESERRLNYQRALQGELQRTIAQLEGIEQARVHLVIPEESVFIREKREATASVVVRLNPLSRLTAEQVKGIVYLIAGSVENLPPENVTVIDTQGRVLSKVEEEGLAPGEQGTSATLTQLEIKRNYEKELEQRLSDMLERVLGMGKVVAMVSVDMDFSRVDSTEISYGDPVQRSRSETVETYEGSGVSGFGGAAGTDSNIPSYAEMITGDTESRYERRDLIENFEVPEILTRTVQAPGKINEISASVIIDNSRGALGSGQIRDLENLVASALGLSEERRGQVSVAAINFDTSYLDETLLAMEEARIAERRQMYIRYGIIGLVILAVFLILWKLLGFARERMEEKQLPLQPAMAELQPALADIMPEAALSVEKESDTMRLKEITEKNPDTVISLLKMWLMEDQR